mmetsp:Transcript_9737/g.14329  ORF Transcript_9737/g.14329 Transcript_9737/m.14329 type:complete len:94 (-) Transcript_9737:1035-1316(-)
MHGILPKMFIYASSSHLIYLDCNLSSYQQQAHRSSKRKSRFRKAPGAPKRFKSAYIFFSTDMMQKIKKEQNAAGSDKQKVSTSQQNLEDSSPI